MTGSDHPVIIVFVFKSLYYIYFVFRQMIKLFFFSYNFHWQLRRWCLSVHNLSDKFFIVDVALWVLLIHEQLFDFVVGQFFAQRCQQMSQFGSGNETASIFIEMTESFDEIVGSIARSCFRNRMVDGKEDFKRNTFVRFQLMCTFFNILFGGILTQGTKAFTYLQIIHNNNKNQTLDAVFFLGQRFVWNYLPDSTEFCHRLCYRKGWTPLGILRKKKKQDVFKTNYRYTADAITIQSTIQPSTELNTLLFGGSYKYMISIDETLKYWTKTQSAYSLDWLNQNEFKAWKICIVLRSSYTSMPKSAKNVYETKQKNKQIKRWSAKVIIRWMKTRRKWICNPVWVCRVSCVCMCVHHLWCRMSTKLCIDKCDVEFSEITNCERYINTYVVNGER